MDLVEYKEEVFEKIKAGYTAFASKLDVKDIHFIPMSALKGDNVVDVSKNTSPGIAEVHYALYTYSKLFTLPAMKTILTAVFLYSTSFAQ